MIPDLTPIFSEYEKFLDEGDIIFNHMRLSNPGCVTCAPGCDDCCHALFDLSLVEAMYLNRAFNRVFGHGRERSDILDRASRTDRELTRMKREFFRAEKDGENSEGIITRVSSLRLACPLLTEAHECALYECRPLTCRLYGIPQDVGGVSHVCGFSAFKPGIKYPAIKMSKVQTRLEAFSADIQKAVQSRFDLSDVYVPVSMALLTRYDEDYLGIGPAKAEE